jgi:hypothetical protein
MDINKIYKGNFWIAGEESNAKNGLLKFWNNTAYVDLFDSFDEHVFSTLSKPSGFRKEICCIYGQLENGRFCALHKCNLKLTGNPFGLISTIINFEYLFYSSNQNLLKKPKYTSITFGFDSLFHWAGINLIEPDLTEQDNISIKQNSVPENYRNIFEDENYRLELFFPSSIPITTLKKELIIKQDAKLHLTLKREQDVLEGFKIVEKIHDAFIIFQGNKVEKENIYHLTTEQGEKHYYCYLNKKRFRNTQAYDINEQNSILNREDLKDINLNRLFETWFELYKTYSYPIEILTNCLSDAAMNRQHKFMSLMYGLEYIHGKDLSNEKAKSFFSEQNAKLIQELEDLIPENSQVNRQNLFGKIQSRLEKNHKLSDKFKAFFNQLNIPILELFSENSDDFIANIVNTRNNFAHVNKKRPRIDIKDLRSYNIKLEAVLLIIFYLKLNIPLDEIQHQIKENIDIKCIIPKP